MSLPKIQFEHTRIPGGLTQVGIFVNGRFFLDYSSPRGFCLDEGLAIAKRALKVYKMPTSLPFREGMEVV